MYFTTACSWLSTVAEAVRLRGGASALATWWATIGRGQWRCSDSLSLREFLLLGCGNGCRTSWLSRTRARLPHEVHTAVFDWAGADRRGGSGEGRASGWMPRPWRPTRRCARAEGHGRGLPGDAGALGPASGIETPTAEDLARLDRKRKGKKLSNQDWVSRSDPEAKIAKMKDAPRTWPTSPSTRWIWTPARWWWRSCTRPTRAIRQSTLAAAEANLEAVDVAPTAEDPAECVTDKGYHSRLVLKALDDGPWKSRISEPKQKGFARWHGDDAARRAVTNNRTRLLSGVARESSCAPRSSSAPLPTTSIAAVCAGPGFGAAFVHKR